MPHLHFLEADGSFFFFYHPGPPESADHRFPFATLVTNDVYDPASNLTRPGVYRLNIGMRPETYRQLFGRPPLATREMGIVDRGYDYTRLDELMPHPVYAPLNWVCILNPSPKSFETVWLLIEEAVSVAAGRAEARAKHMASAQDTAD